MSHQYKYGTRAQTDFTLYMRLGGRGKVAGLRDLFVPQSFDGIETGGFASRIKAEKDSHKHRENGRRQNSHWRDHHGPSRERSDQFGRSYSQQDPDYSSEHAEHHGFYQELPLHIFFRGADGHADADLARALSHRHQHDVHDANAAHDQRDACN